MTIRTMAGLGAGLVLLAGLLAGCGDDDGDDNGGSGGDGGASAEEFADQSYDEIKQSAIDAMGGLEAVHVDADIATEGQEATLDLSMDADGNCTGTVAFGGISVDVLQADGEAWFKPSPELLEQQFGDQATAVKEFVGDSWVADTKGEVTPSNCDLEGFLEQVTDDGQDETNTEVAGLENLDGDEVVRIDFTNDDGDGSAFILAEGEHYIAKLEVAGDEPGSVRFSEFDEDVDTEAPAEDEVVDLADFQA